MKIIMANWNAEIKEHIRKSFKIESGDEIIKYIPETHIITSVTWYESLSELVIYTSPIYHHAEFALGHVQMVSK